jgi:hypothetical protein
MRWTVSVPMPSDLATFLRKLMSNLPFRRTVYLRSAELHALSNRALEAGFDSFANHCALKLSERAGLTIAKRWGWQRLK